MAAPCQDEGEDSWRGHGARSCVCVCGKENSGLILFSRVLAVCVSLTRTDCSWNRPRFVGGRRGGRCLRVSLSVRSSRNVQSSRPAAGFTSLTAPLTSPPPSAPSSSLMLPPRLWDVSVLQRCCVSNECTIAPECATEIGLGRRLEGLPTEM